MLYNNIIDASDAIDANKSSDSKDNVNAVKAVISNNVSFGEKHCQ